jgi:hypothetical protein
MSPQTWACVAIVRARPLQLTEIVSSRGAQRLEQSTRCSGTPEPKPLGGTLAGQQRINRRVDVERPFSQQHQADIVGWADKRRDFAQDLASFVWGHRRTNDLAAQGVTELDRVAGNKLGALQTFQ